MWWGQRAQQQEETERTGAGRRGRGGGVEDREGREGKKNGVEGRRRRSTSAKTLARACAGEDVALPADEKEASRQGPGQEGQLLRGGLAAVAVKTGAVRDTRAPVLKSTASKALSPPGPCQTWSIKHGQAGKYKLHYDECRPRGGRVECITRVKDPDTHGRPMNYG